MVNLPGPNEQRARAVNERSARYRRSRPHYFIGESGRRREEFRRMAEPTNLTQLELLAKRTVDYLEKHNPKTESNYIVAMDLLRQQYNLHFIVLCEKCGGTHARDELLAPER